MEDALYEHFCTGVIDRDQYKRNVAKIRADRERYFSLHHQTELAIHDSYAEVADRLLELAINAESKYKAMTPAEKRDFIKTVCSNHLLDGQTVRYSLRNSFRVLVAMCGNEGWLTIFDGALKMVPPARGLHEVPFAATLMARDKDFLYQEYAVAGKSIKQIAREERCAPSTVAKYLLEFGIEPRPDRLPRQRRGQIPFGMKMRNGLLVPHLAEQATIEKLRQLRSEGKPYGDLVDWLNTNGIRSKNGGRWDRPTVYKILKRATVTTL